MITSNSGVDMIKPVYIIGNSRSGTTLLSKILGKNNEIFSFEELNFFEELCTTDLNLKINYEKAKEICSTLLAVQRGKYYRKYNKEKYYSEINKIVYNKNNYSPICIYQQFLRYETIKNSKKYPLEQVPRYTYYVKEIKKYIPESRFIHIVRDPRDVLLSQKNKWKRRFLGKWVPLKETIRSWANYHPIIISKLWNSTVTIADENIRIFGGLTVRFEDLIYNPEFEVRRICEFLGVNYQSEMLDVEHTGSSNFSDNKISKKISNKAVGNWVNKLSDTEIYWCQIINNKLIDKYNYKKIETKENIIKKIINCTILVPKACLSLALNLERNKNIFESIKRRIVKKS